MSKSYPDIEAIVKVFRSYCEEKNYQIQQSEEANNIRLEISNFSERAIVKIYTTGTIVVQGKQNPLKEEVVALKENFEANPHSFIRAEIAEIRACVTRYDVMLPELRIKIKESLDALGARLEFTENPKSDIEYKAKISRYASSLTLTQFNNGTLLLQGKTDKLFDSSCDLIERIANPSDKEVIARFISSDENNLGLFEAKYTPQLIEIAEDNVKEMIGVVYEYLEPHDQKWFVASECLCLTKIPLPELSPLVMPASKAFEGFAKKLLIGIGLFESDHFKTKKGTFSVLNDTTNPKRKDICEKEKHADTMLKKISLCLDMNRNFMMHSDDSQITKVNNQEDAEKKVNIIFADTKEIFEYFDGIFNLQST
jgi:hypothetical protein